MDYRNAQLALKRARSDSGDPGPDVLLQCRRGPETVRVTKAVARYTDEIYLLQADLLAGKIAAPHEPAALRAQAYTIRLGYKQAIATYVYAWKQLVAAIGLRQLPLSEVDGQVDRLIPFYDYDAVLAHVLRNHTDVLTAAARSRRRSTTSNLPRSHRCPMSRCVVTSGKRPRLSRSRPSWLPQ